MKHAYIWYGAVCVLVGSTSAELHAFSNPFKKNDLAARWQTFNDAISNYKSDTMKLLDDYATKSKSKMKKQDIEKRFKDIQTAYDDLMKAMDADPKKAQAMKSTINQDIASQQKKLDELKLVESLLLRRSAGFYDQIARSYAANELKMPVSVRVTAQQVYPFLGVTIDQGRAMSIDDINNTLKIARGVMKGSTQERDSLFRQLGWYFQNKYAKQEFDAFLKNRDAVKALELPNDVIALLQDRFLEIPAIVLMFSEVQDKIS